jgi:hypothetical protein
MHISGIFRNAKLQIRESRKTICIHKCGIQTPYPVPIPSFSSSSHNTPILVAPLQDIHPIIILQRTPWTKQQALPSLFIPEEQKKKQGYRL